MVSRQRLTITDAVMFDRFFSIGEEPVPTCQSYNKGEFKEGLMACLSEPTIKIIQIYNEDGNFIARSVLRLMQDESGDPQLYLEPTYSTNNHRAIEDACLRFAQQKAQEMGVKLCKDAKSFTAYSGQSKKVTLRSLGGRADFGYSDALHGLYWKNRFSIPDAVVV